jgi:hypothetical protein
MAEMKTITDSQLTQAGHMEAYENGHGSNLGSVNNKRPGILDKLVKPPYSHDRSANGKPAG